MDKEQSLRPPNSVIWDCGSSLYDSYELKSFQRQLDAAITRRTLSMPHFSDYPPPAPRLMDTPKKQSRFAKSLNKLLRSVFRIKPRSGLRVRADGHEENGYYSAYSLSATLASIPEASEKELGSPELDATVRKTQSERFTSTTAAAQRKALL